MRAYLRADAVIGNNFYRPVREQQINQQTAVVLGVPHAQLREQFDRPRSALCGKARLTWPCVISRSLTMRLIFMITTSPAHR